MNKETRGRKRKFNPMIPSHINQDKLPSNCYFDSSGSGHWYTTYTDERGKNRRKKIASNNALLSELHGITEKWNGIDRKTFRWIANEYFNSDKFKSLTKRTAQDYQYSYQVICEYITRVKKPLADIPLKRWDAPLVQKFIDKLNITRGPTAAKHVHSFIRLVFRWSKNRGYTVSNPAIGTELPKERKLQRLPSQSAYNKLVAYAKLNGTHRQKTAGSCPHYIWPVMEIEYLCRLRGVECRNLTDNDIRDNGLRVDRRKGSNTNITCWNERLRKAINYLRESRDEIWNRNKKAYPLNPQVRPLIVNTLGERLKASAYQSAWQRFIRGAIEKEVILESERFSLHDLKRKGVTDTPGTQADKMDASGHKDPRMMDVYDKSIKTVKPASE